MNSDYSLQSWMDRIDKFIGNFDVWEADTAIHLTPEDYTHGCMDEIFFNRVVPALLGIEKPFEAEPVAARYEARTVRGRFVIVSNGYYRDEGTVLRINISTAAEKVES